MRSVRLAWPYGPCLKSWGQINGPLSGPIGPIQLYHLICHSSTTKLLTRVLQHPERMLCKTLLLSFNSLSLLSRLCYRKLWRSRNRRALILGCMAPTRRVAIWDIKLSKRIKCQSSNGLFLCIEEYYYYEKFIWKNLKILEWCISFFYQRLNRSLEELSPKLGYILAKSNFHLKANEKQ